MFIQRLIIDDRIISPNKDLSDSDVFNPYPFIVTFISQRSLNRAPSSEVGASIPGMHSIDLQVI